MFLRPHNRSKDGKTHAYWSLVETVRTADGPRQKTICYLGELNSSAQARWLKTVEALLCDWIAISPEKIGRSFNPRMSDNWLNVISRRAYQWETRKTKA